MQIGANRPGRRPVRTLAARVLAIALVATAAILGAVGAEPDRLTDLERRIAELERQLAEARGEGGDEARLEEIERAIEVLAEEIETLKVKDEPQAMTDEDWRTSGSRYGLGPGAAKVYRRDRGVSVGGYGEALYESFSSSREDGTPSGAKDQLDFLRAVMYFGYKFNDRIVFNSEIEFEHASTGREGEVSVEFAYLDFLVRDEFNVRAGMFLAPLGFVNELHEAPIFLGTERPFVEQRILPTTWRENGVGVFGGVGQLTYRAYVGTGLAGVGGTASGADGFGASGVRGGRQQGSKAAAEDLWVYGRLDWEPLAGLVVGLSGATGGSGQGEITPTTQQEIGGRTTIWDAHVDWRWRGLQVRGLYAATSIDDVDLINEAQGLTGDQSVGEEQYGWYGEVGYDVLSHVASTRHALIPYVRHERYDTQDRVPDGFASNPANDVTVTTLGIAWKPIVNVIVKADFNRIENEARTGTDQFNVAIGYLF